MTSVTAARRSLFQATLMADLLLNVFHENRARERFLLHEYVVMFDHFHLLITPTPDVSLEKAVQFVKGGFSFRAARELEFRGEVWERSFTEHRVRDASDYDQHRAYIHENPVKRFLAPKAETYTYSSANPKAEIDPAPPWLKPPK